MPQRLNRRLRPEPLEEDHARSRQQGNDDLVVHAVRVVQRHDVQQPVVWTCAGVAEDAVGVARHAAMPQEHALGPAGAARCEEHHRAVLAPDSAVDEGAALIQRTHPEQRQTAQRSSMEPLDQALVDDEALHADDVRLFGNPVECEVRIDEAYTGPGLHRSQVRRDRRNALWRNDAEDLAAHDTRTVDTGGVAIDAAAEIRVGDWFEAGECLAAGRCVGSDRPTETCAERRGHGLTSPEPLSSQRNRTAASRWN
jgi:hypothetical protein